MCGQSYENLTTEKFNVQKLFNTKNPQFTVYHSPITCQYQVDSYFETLPYFISEYQRVN